MARHRSFTHSQLTLQRSPQVAWQRPAPEHNAVQSSLHDTEQLGLPCEHPKVQCPVAAPHSWWHEIPTGQKQIPSLVGSWHGRGRVHPKLRLSRAAIRIDVPRLTDGERHDIYAFKLLCAPAPGDKSLGWQGSSGDRHGERRTGG